MNTLIEIHDDNTDSTGYYSVWLKHEGQTLKRKCSEALVNSFLNMKQKHDFFMGKWKFKILESDFKDLLSMSAAALNNHKHES